MIKILHVVSSLNINAGMMSVVMNYYRHLDRSKIQFDFLYFEESDQTHQEEIELLGGRTFFLKYPTFKPSDQKKIWIFFSEHKGEYMAVHCHPIWASEIIGHEAKRSGIKHIIQHSHSTKFAETKKSEIRNRILMKFIGLFATDFIACSPEAAFLFGKKRVNQNRVLILPNAITTELYKFDDVLRKKIRDEFDIGEKTFVIGNVGRLSPQKNQVFCLEIYRALHNLYQDSKLLIVGEGGLRKLIEERIELLGLTEHVIMTGKRRDICAILSALDLFLMPSIFEGSPVSAIEALASGLPCVVSDTITKSIKMEGVNYLSLNETPLKWAETCVDTINEKKKDRTDVSALIENGFDIRQAVDILEKFYLDLR